MTSVILPSCCLPPLPLRLEGARYRPIQGPSIWYSTRKRNSTRLTLFNPAYPVHHTYIAKAQAFKAIPGRLTLRRIHNTPHDTFVAQCQLNLLPETEVGGWNTKSEHMSCKRRVPSRSVLYNALLEIVMMTAMLLNRLLGWDQGMIKYTIYSSLAVTLGHLTWPGFRLVRVPLT
jgi:hypothetical protein